MESNSYVLHIELDNLPSKESDAENALSEAITGESSDSAASTNSNKQLRKTLKGIKNPRSALKQLVKESPYAQYAGLAAFGVGEIITTTATAVSTSIANIGSRYGNQARQNEITNKLTTANMTTSIIGETLGGAATGAMAGPIGAAVGAAIGLAASATKQAIQIVDRLQDYEHDMAAWTIGSTRASERLGVLSTDRNR